MKKNIESAYLAKKYEKKIYQKWEKSNLFKTEIDKSKEPFMISMPPPNATGVLHLGHAAFLAIQDLMVRLHRMKGNPTFWLPGTDHAAIATQSVVEKKLQNQGIKNPREELGRKKLLDEIKKFVEDSKTTIRKQIKSMGASCDWDEEKYTLDKELNVAVNTFFQYMYEDELIYRGGRIVNWDPKMQTTVADDEIEYQEENSKFYYFQYGPVIIGTARPETKFLDKIIVVHPNDKRYKDIIGKEFEHEWIEGKIKSRVIADKCIDMEMGTGAMTITPAHSMVDFELAQKHNLETPQIIDFEGKIRKDVSKEFGGMPIEKARQKIVEKLDKKGLLVKIDEDYQHKVAINYRGKGIIEPQIMKQWFINVNKKAIDWKGNKRSIKEVMQDVIKSKMIQIVPKKFEKTYFHWIDNLRDWCISRQIWWGHQIPMWYKVNKEQYEAFKSQKDASSLLLNVLGVDGETKFSKEKPKGDYWIQDPDTLDTWFSSALWTFSTLGWPEKTEKMEYFHPTNVLETGYDILFFWVARMILASTYALRRDGYPEEKCIPFKTVYLHGLIRDRKGKKMSKSNPETCIDPLEVIDDYGADALRLSLIIGSSPGNDMRLYKEKIAGYRNFVNKIWNATRFALMNVEKNDIKKDFDPNEIKTIADKWILTELQKLIKEVNSNLQKYRYSDAGTRIYEFFWKFYCDWYLEMSKGDNKNSAVLIHVLKQSLKLLHPFMPFVTEKLWEFIDSDSMIMNQPWPKYDKKMIYMKDANSMELIQGMITQIRSIRAELKVEPSKMIKAIVYSKKHLQTIEDKREVLMRMARIESLELKEKGKKVEKSKTVFLDDIEIFIPLADLIDTDKERNRIKKQIEQKEKYISGLNSKLDNPKFLANAPAEVIEQNKSNIKEAMNVLEKLKEQLKDLE